MIDVSHLTKLPPNQEPARREGKTKSEELKVKRGKFNVVSD